ncbi:hypothetical protein F5Y11DRAFT_161258 [Daldinia sp. FL1419]|nr:hypothetical protein F5Y11DRAFT_161258 [Daldinia sp. FL1419]
MGVHMQSRGPAITSAAVLLCIPGPLFAGGILGGRHGLRMGGLTGRYPRGIYDRVVMRATTTRLCRNRNLQWTWHRIIHTWNEDGRIDIRYLLVSSRLPLASTGCGL